MIKVL